MVEEGIKTMLRDNKSGEMRLPRRSVTLLIIILVALAIPVSPPTGSAQQDLTFRLINLEREVESLRARVDILERMVRSGNTPDPLGGAGSAQSMVEIQRQMLALAEQQIMMQTQLLELRKAIDRLEEKAPPARSKPGEEGRRPPGN